MALIKKLSIGKIDFDSSGQVDGIDAITGVPPIQELKIYIERSGKDLTILPTEKISGKSVRLPLRLAGKLLRLVKDFDKIGRKAVDL